jgi:quercetin dioxygenase-like cupin family protein
MREDKLRKLLLGICLLVVPVSPPDSLLAQDNALQRVELQKLDLPPDKVAFMDLVTIAAKGAVLPATHPGVQSAYVIEGEFALKIEGQSDLLLTPGMSFKIPAGARYSFENHGATPAKLIDFVVEKDTPAETPAP